MEVLELDLKDDSLQGTPDRVAKMYVEEIFSGLTEPFPKATAQLNKFKYDQMLIESGITVNSLCEHHFVPIVGFAHIAYVPGKKLLGLSKFNRIVEHYSRRPQVQERLTNQIHEKLKEILETDDVGVVIDAVHYCVKLRGVKHDNCMTRTSAISGCFKKDAPRSEFFTSIPTHLHMR